LPIFITIAKLLFIFITPTKNSKYGNNKYGPPRFFFLARLKYLSTYVSCKIQFLPIAFSKGKPKGAKNFKNSPRIKKISYPCYRTYIEPARVHYKPSVDCIEHEQLQPQMEGESCGMSPHSHSSRYSSVALPKAKATQKETQATEVI